MSQKNLSITKIVINSIIVILEIIGFVLIISKLKLGAFLYYTECSNLLLLISSSILIYKSYRDLKGKPQPCKIFEILRYSSCLSVFVTFLVVLTILGPIMENGYYGAFISGSMKYHHLLCPLLGTFSFIFLEKYEFDSRDVIRSLYFTVIYAIILISLNIANVVDGPYPFLRVHDQSILTSILYFFGIVGGTVVLSIIFKVTNYKFTLLNEKNRKKK